MERVLQLLTVEFAVDLGNVLRWGKLTVPCLLPVTHHSLCRSNAFSWVRTAHTEVPLPRQNISWSVHKKTKSLTPIIKPTEIHCTDWFKPVGCSESCWNLICPLLGSKRSCMYLTRVFRIHFPTVPAPRVFLCMLILHI